MMRKLAELPLLVILMGIAAAAMFIPAAHAAILREYEVGRAFLYSGAIALIGVVMVAIATSRPRAPGGGLGGLATFAAAYLVLPLILALPLTQRSAGGAAPGDAWFEMVSAFTTTGATLFAPEALPDTVHLWRAMVGWAGGFFMILMAAAVLAPLNLGVTGAALARGRPGAGRALAAGRQRLPGAELTRRIRRAALRLFPLYATASLALWIGLILAGDSSFVALCHAMSTLSTSGISPVGGLAQGQSGVAGEGLVFLFLIAALSRLVLGGRITRAADAGILRDPELRLAALLLVLVPAVLTLRHWHAVAAMDSTGLAETVWAGLFLTMSFLTTTGFDASTWQLQTALSGVHAPGMVLMGLAIVGGGVATCAGGIKLLHVHSLLRHGQRELDRIIYPDAVGSAGQLGRDGLLQGAYLAWVFFMLFATSLGLCAAALMILSVDFEAALVFSISALTLTGPLVDVVRDTPLAYGGLSDGALWVLGIAMVVGRLETLAILVLLAPDGWRR